MSSKFAFISKYQSGTGEGAQKLTRWALSPPARTPAQACANGCQRYHVGVWVRSVAAS